MIQRLCVCLLAVFCVTSETTAQTDQKRSERLNPPKVLYGTASFYADKFEGRETANGEIFSQKHFTAACNVLPLGTWIRVTNLRNHRSVVVKINDRLHVRMKRIVDLSKAAARKIRHLDGLVRVKIEVLGQRRPEG